LLGHSRMSNASAGTRDEGLERGSVGMAFGSIGSVRGTEPHGDVSQTCASSVGRLGPGDE
jgi:hypothetical protein